MAGVPRLHLGLKFLGPAERRALDEVASRPQARFDLACSFPLPPASPR